MRLKLKTFKFVNGREVLKLCTLREQWPEIKLEWNPQLAFPLPCARFTKCIFIDSSREQYGNIYIILCTMYLLFMYIYCNCISLCATVIRIIYKIF